jgi:rhodanese-related sulfurtransferase
MGPVRLSLLCGLSALILASALAWPARAGHSDPSGPVAVISADELTTLLAAGAKPYMVDLRSADDFREGHLPFARSIPLAQLQRRVWEIPRGRVILYCECPREELEAAWRFVVARASELAKVLDVSFADWARRGLLVER